MSEQILEAGDLDQKQAEQNLNFAIPDYDESKKSLEDKGGEPKMSSEGIAYIAVNGLAEIVSAEFECLSYDDEIKSEAIAKLVPVLNKYNVESAFFEKWKEEFMLGVFFAGVIFTSYKKVIAFKKEQELLKEKTAVLE